MPTANGWELYTCSDDREIKVAIRAAVPALNAALRQAKKEVKARIRQAIKDGKLAGDKDGRRFYIDLYSAVEYRERWNGEKYPITSADRVRNIIDSVCSDIMDEVQEEHSVAGASDSEPSWVAFDEVRKAACEQLHIDPREGRNYFPRF